MTKKEMIERNKQIAAERMHATAEYQEAQQLLDSIETAHKAGNNKEAKRLYWQAKRLLREAKANS